MVGYGQLLTAARRQFMPPPPGKKRKKGPKGREQYAQTARPSAFNRSGRLKNSPKSSTLLPRLPNYSNEAMKQGRPFLQPDSVAISNPTAVLQSLERTGKPNFNNQYTYPYWPNSFPYFGIREGKLKLLLRSRFLRTRSQTFSHFNSTQIKNIP